MAQTTINGATQIRSGTVPLSALVSGYAIPTANLIDGANFLKRDGSVAMTASLNAGGFTITNGAAGVNATDLVIKSQLDAVKSGFRVHFVRLVSVTNISSLSGLGAIDGVTPSAGDLVLLTAQTTASQNGIWTAASGSWTRPAEWSTATTLTEGQYVIADPDGTTYKNTKWFCINTGIIVVDTTATTFQQDLSGTSYGNGSGLSLTGTTFAVKLGNGLVFDGSSNVAVTADSARLLQATSSGIGIKDGTAGQVVIANSSGNASYQTLSGDVTVTSGGVTAVNNVAGAGFVKYGNFITNETPSGTVNGSNATFTLANSPQAGTLQLLLDGVVQEPGSGNDYTLSGATITMLLIPQTGDKLRANYLK